MRPRRTRSHQRGNTTNEQTHGAGIALVEAILDGDREQVQIIHHLYGTEETLVALAVTERHALRACGSVSTDALFDLADLHQREHSYRSVAVRVRDRFGTCSPAIRYARRYSKCQLQQYFHISAGREERGPRSLTPVGANRAAAAVFGAGYATALTVVHLAAVGERDWVELLDEMRATIASERVLPPEVMPPA